MTRRRMPRRDRANGRFINRQRGVRTAPREEKRTVAPPLPPPIRECSIASDPRELFVARLFGRHDRQRCEECGEELTYAWMHSGRAVYHVGRCMRCNPEPPVIVRE